MFKRLNFTVLIITALLFIGYIPHANADESVDNAIASVKGQIENVHEHYIKLVADMDKAWNDFRDDPSPANEQRVNKYAQDRKILNERSKDLWNWLHTLRNESSMTINTLRQILGETQQMMDSAAEWTRGVVPGATWVLGASEKTLYNERWQEAEAAFSAMAAKGKELRGRRKAILDDMLNKACDTPANRKELEALEKEIGIWEAKMETISEVFEFLRADMPAEVVFWNELTGPYVEAVADNVQAKLEEIILWDTLGGTSPIERIYKLFKPALQLKLGDTFFSDPVLTDRVRNIVVMEVLFADASLDRLQKSFEIGVGKLLDNGSVQKAAAELLGSRQRREELRTLLTNMSYDQIPARARSVLGGKIPAKPTGPVANFVASGLSADEVNRLKKIKNSKAVADGVFKVANELLGPALNWGDFTTALEKAKEECGMYRKAYKGLRAAKIIGAGTFVGIRGEAATSAEDNFVNICFENPEAFVAYLNQWKEAVKGIDVKSFKIEKTYRDKPVDVENDVVEAPEEPDGDSYEAFATRLTEIWEQLWTNQIAPEAVYPELKAIQDGNWEVHSKKINLIKNRYMALYKERDPAAYSCISAYNGAMSFGRGCPEDFLQAVDDDWKAYVAANTSFQHPYYEQRRAQLPTMGEAYITIKERLPVDAVFLRGPESGKGIIGTYTRKMVVEKGPIPSPEALNAGLWHLANSPQAYRLQIFKPPEFLSDFFDAPTISLLNGGTTIRQWEDNVRDLIDGLKGYLAAKGKEKTQILAVSAEIDQLAETLGERRNFFKYAVQDSAGSLRTEEGRLLVDGFNVDDTLTDLTDFSNRFTVAFDRAYASYEAILEQLEEILPDIQKLSGTYDGYSGILPSLMDRYVELTEELVDGRRRVQDNKVDVITRIFEQGISTNLEGSTYLQSLMDAADIESLTQEEIDAVVKNGHDAFAPLFEVVPINHPALRYFISPSLERIKKAREMLWAAQTVEDDLLSIYQKKEQEINGLENRLSDMMQLLRAVSQGIAPGLSFMSDMRGLESTRTVRGYSDWMSLRRPVSEFITIPQELYKDLRDQERYLMAYHAFVDEILLNRPVSSVISPRLQKYIDGLYGLYEKVDREGGSWLGLERSAFTKTYNEISGKAHELYSSAVNLGAAPDRGPVHAAYSAVLGKLHPLDEAFRKAYLLIDVKENLTALADGAQAFLNEPVGIPEAEQWVNRLKTATDLGTDADKLRSNSAVAVLIVQCRDLMSRLSGWITAERQTDTLGPARALITEFYNQFKVAYESRDEYKVMSLISDDWEAGDGTTLADLEMNLSRTFRVFDEISYAIQNLNIYPGIGQTYTVIYDVTIISRIYNRNLKHEEKCTVNEQIIKDETGKIKIMRTLQGRFW